MAIAAANARIGFVRSPPVEPSAANTSVGEKTVNSKSAPPNTPIPTREDLESENITLKIQLIFIGMIFLEKFKNMIKTDSYSMLLSHSDHEIVEVYKSKEAFIASSTRDIIPVISIENNIIGDGNVGIATKKIMEL